MKMFLSRYCSKVDGNGRFSIPAPYRNVMQNKSSIFLYAYPSFVNQCIEVCTEDAIAHLYEYIENLPMFSPERTALSSALFSGSEELTVDSKGRVGMSKTLFDFADITNESLFAGKGDRFEIWNPKRFEEHFQESRDAAKTFVRNKQLLQLKMDT